MPTSSEECGNRTDFCSVFSASHDLVRRQIHLS